MLGPAVFPRHILPSPPVILTVKVSVTVMSNEGDLLVLVDFNSHEYPWFWPFSFPIMKLHYDIKLQIVNTPEGKKFCTQVSSFCRSSLFCLGQPNGLVQPISICSPLISSGNRARGTIIGECFVGSLDDLQQP